MTTTLRTIRRTIRAALTAGPQLVTAVRGARFRVLVAIYRAIDTSRNLRIRYTDTHGTVSVRTITPHRLDVTAAGNITVRAYDWRDADDTTFRTDRIAALKERIARRALATINTPANARILAVVRTGTVIIIATHTPDERIPYCVDSYRLLSPAERAQEADWGWESSGWFLTEQHGGDTLDEVDALLDQAIAYANSVTLAA